MAVAVDVGTGGIPFPMKMLQRTRQCCTPVDSRCKHNTGCVPQCSQVQASTHTVLTEVSAVQCTWMSGFSHFRDCWYIFKSMIIGGPTPLRDCGG
jgi:hypothetical protein